MKFSIFSTVACMAAGVFAAPAVADAGLIARDVDAVKRDVTLSTITSALKSAISQTSTITSDVADLASGSTTSLTQIFEDITGLNRTLTIIVDIVEELNLDATDAASTVITGLISLFNLGGSVQITILLYSLEAGVNNILEEIKKLGSGSDLLDELEIVAKVVGGSPVESVLTNLENVLVNVISLIDKLPIIGPVLATLITNIIKSI